MELSTIKGIGPSKQTKLNDAGIKTVGDLAHANVASLAETTGISASTIKGYKEQAVALTLIEDVKGIGPKTIQTLAEAGIRSLKDLASASSDFIAKEAAVAQEKAKEWKAQAETLAKRVAEDAKTPEGRQKLANEGKDFATTTAKKAEAAAKDAIAIAQKEGEMVIAKAKDLADKAPERVKVGQEKATALVKEAETFVKTEVEKVKAQNEGLLTRLKAKFRRN